MCGADSDLGPSFFSNKVPFPGAIINSSQPWSCPVVPTGEAKKTWEPPTVWDKGSVAPAVQPSAPAKNPLYFPCPESRGRPLQRARAGKRTRERGEPCMRQHIARACQTPFGIVVFSSRV